MNLNRKISVDIDASGASSGAKKATDALKEVDAQARKTGGGLSVLDHGGGKAAKSMSLAGTAAGAFGGVLAGLSIAAFAKSVFDAGAAMDSMERSFTAITGNSTAASAEMFFLREEADRLGQSFYDLAPQFKQIAAAARGTALEGEQTREIFSAITEASTALGLSSDETSGALNALSQMISKGTVQAEELRGQLGERLPGAFQIAARAMGVSTQELGKMLEQGEVLATDLLPKLADELHNMYGTAAETTGLESARSAVNRLSGAWTDFKVNLFHSEPAVIGINAVTAALKEMSDEANSLSRIRQDMFRIGETMSSSQFLTADREERIKMLNLGGENTYRGTVNREMVMPAYSPPAASASASASSGKASASSAAKEAKAREQAYKKMIVDGQNAANVLDAYWKNYEDARVKAITGEVAAHESVNAQDLQILTEFADKHREIVVGETAFKLEQIEVQAEAYRRAGADEVAVAQWANAEKLNLATDWASGLERGLLSAINSGANAAQAMEDVVNNAFNSMSDELTDFVLTGKADFSDFADSVVRDITRMIMKQALFSVLKMAMGSFGGGMLAFNEKGGAYKSPSLSAYSGEVYDKPQIFAFAHGAGVFGEAGPEAIMPLARDSSGNLGVRTTGSGTTIQVNVTNNTNAQASVKETKTQNGTRLDVIIEDIVARSVTGRGKVGQAIQTSFRAQYKGA